MLCGRTAAEARKIAHAHERGLAEIGRGETLSLEELISRVAD